MDSALPFAATKIQPPRARSTRLSPPPLEAALGDAQAAAWQLHSKVETP